MIADYSPAEQALFRALSPKDADTLMKLQNPLSLFNWMCYWAFIEDIKGPAAEALRRGLRHLNEGKYRGAEFDKLLEIK